MVKYAYVTTLFGNNIYLTGALILGYSLMKTDTSHDRIIMVTPDVSDKYRSILKSVYTRVLPIEYLDASPNIFIDKNTRFKNVFTKLQCLTLIEYQKIVLLDIDMIVLKNIDHLFLLDAPAACIKKYTIPYGKKIPPNIICTKDSKLIGSINAGLILLEPNLIDWEFIKSDIMKDDQKHQFRYPEQDYLSLLYCNKWTSISFNYNFQFGLTKRVKKMRYKIHAIYVVHYSSSYKPWSYLLPDWSPNIDEQSFISLHEKYYMMWKEAYTSIREKFANDGIELPY